MSNIKWKVSFGLERKVRNFLMSKQHIGKVSCNKRIMVFEEQ